MLCLQLLLSSKQNRAERATYASAAIRMAEVEHSHRRAVTETATTIEEWGQGV